MTQACLVRMNLGGFAQNTEMKGSCKRGGVAGTVGAQKESRVELTPEESGKMK